MSNELERLRLVHHHAGYLRVQAAALRGDGATVEALRAVVESIPGHRRCSHNARTGSFVVEYEPGTVDADELLERMADAAGLSGVEHDIRRAMNRRELVSTFMDTVEGLNRVARQATAGRADLRELVPAALWATSLVSFVLHDERGRLPSWDSALYRGYRIFMQWHRSEVSAREREGRKEEDERDLLDAESGDARR